MSRRSLAILAVVVAIVSIGWVAQNRLLASREGEWVEATRGDLVMGVEVTGVLEAVESARLGPPQIPDKWDFKISMMAPEGSEVKQGQPVLGFDASELQRTLEEKIAERDSARKQIEKAQADLAIRKEEEELSLANAQARLRKADLKLEAPDVLRGSNERRQIELEQALARQEIHHRRGRLASFAAAATREIALLTEKESRAAAAVADIQDRIQMMTVRAPRAGTVVYVTNWRNEKKKVGDSCWRMERVLEIPDLSVMTARGEVDEANAGRVRMDQPATLRLDAHPDEELAGRITMIAKTVQRQSPRTPLKILKVDIALDGSDPDKMRPGMRFRGRLETARARNVVSVPHDAILTSAEGPIAVRKTMTGQEMVRVELGRRNDERIEVVNGLDAGDRILLKKGAAEEEGNGS